MDKLEEYFKLNREAFDDQEIPDGHCDRFEERLETLRYAQGDRIAAQGDRIVAQSDRMADQVVDDVVAGRKVRSKKPLVWLASIASAAAVIAAAIFINKAAIDSPADKAIDWFLGVGDDQALICQTYYSKAAEIYEEALRGGIDESTEWQMALMLRDDAALIDQLPDEMSSEERAEVLKDYYGALLDGMNKMK